jgi:hypothetical protein
LLDLGIVGFGVRSAVGVVAVVGCYLVVAYVGFVRILSRRREYIDLSQ